MMDLAALADQDSAILGGIDHLLVSQWSWPPSYPWGWPN
jgi:hypothetical protein